MKFTTLENFHPMDVYWRAGQSHDANPVSAFQSLPPTADPDQNTVPTIPIICQIKTFKLKMNEAREPIVTCAAFIIIQCIGIQITLTLTQTKSKIQRSIASAVS